jgi:hypothetical protein
MNYRVLLAVLLLVCSSAAISAQSAERAMANALAAEGIATWVRLLSK